MCGERSVDIPSSGHRLGPMNNVRPPRADFRFFRWAASLRPLIGVLAAVFVLSLNVSAAPRAEHVFIISIDGGKPAVIQKSKMPVLKQMTAEGACTWTALTIYPSI